jgi:transglutaminase-like putative cysteine protease
MKGFRIFAFALLAVGGSMLFASCGASDTSAYTVHQMADVIAASQDELPPLSAMTSEEEYFARHLENVYMLDADVLQNGAIYFADGAEASEIAVLELTEEAEPEQVAVELEQYITRRASDFTGYFPQEAALVQNSTVSVNGDYVALLICEDPTAAETTFLACFGAEPPALPATPVITEPTEPAAPAMATEAETEAETATEADAATEAETAAGIITSAVEYDHDAIVAAWQNGDWSGLSEKNLAIMEICANAIDEIITGSMADHEKELAVHDWICDWVAYDEALMSNRPKTEPTPDNNNPYGALVSQTADCEGYTLSFQLFMDMLGIECTTVYGTDLWGYENHAWNMVRLSDGEWYCVDVTWDDTADVTNRVNAPINHKYFNVTSAYMYQNDHQWDRTTVPEATSRTFME